MHSDERFKGFNASAFKTGFRAACSAHGVDPCVGASVYQVANIRADIQTAAHQVEPMPSGAFDELGRHVSTTEAAALENLQHTERVARVGVVAQLADAGFRYVFESDNELTPPVRPLRELDHMRGIARFCPVCSATHFHQYKTRRGWRCDQCGTVYDVQIVEPTAAAAL
jgi:hypothetical protein